MWLSDYQFDFDLDFGLTDFDIPEFSPVPYSYPETSLTQLIASKPLLMADDYTDNSSTTGHIYFNGMNQDVNTDFAGDSDWLKLTGTAGQTGDVLP